jgi:hypothetical protein
MKQELVDGFKICLVVVLAFAFGWTSCGYKIYAQDFAYMGAVMKAIGEK